MGEGRDGGAVPTEGNVGVCPGITPTQPSPDRGGGLSLMRKLSDLTINKNPSLPNLGREGFYLVLIGSLAE